MPSKWISLKYWPVVFLVVTVFLLCTSSLTAAFPVQIVSDYWRSGLVSPTAPAALDFAGRGLSPSFLINTSSPTERYLAFPPPGQPREVLSARMNLLERSGTAVSALLTLEVFSMSGDFQRTISTTPVGLMSGPIGEWVTLDLQASSAVRTLKPGEFLAFHLTMEPSDLVSLQPIFEVVVGLEPYTFSLPIINK